MYSSNILILSDSNKILDTFYSSIYHFCAFNSSKINKNTVYTERFCYSSNSLIMDIGWISDIWFLFIRSYVYTDYVYIKLVQY